MNTRGKRSKEFANKGGSGNWLQLRPPVLIQTPDFSLKTNSSLALPAIDTDRPAVEIWLASSTAVALASRLETSGLMSSSAGASTTKTPSGGRETNAPVFGL